MLKLKVFLHIIFCFTWLVNIKQLTITYKCTLGTSAISICISGAADPWCLMITPPLEIAISQKDFNVEWV